MLVDEVFAAGADGQRVSNEVLWLLADHQGTIRDIVDDNGVLRKHVDYDSFGNSGSLSQGLLYYDANGQLIEGTEAWAHYGDAIAVDQLFAYTGQERDEDTNAFVG